MVKYGGYGELTSTPTSSKPLQLDFGRLDHFKTCNLSP